MVLFTVNSDIGLSGGNQLCGNLTGQHGMNSDDIFAPTSINFFMLISVYLDVDPINILDPLRLFAFVGNSEGAYKWNIKISLIDCKLNTEIQGKQIRIYND